VAVARRLLCEFARDAGASTGELDAIRLAISESVTNAVLHGCAGRPGEIHIAAAISGDQMSVRVTDPGPSPHATAEQTPHADPAPRQKSSPGLGWGLTLIAQAADDLSIETPPRGGTEVQMRFRLSARSATSRRPGRLLRLARPVAIGPGAARRVAHLEQIRRPLTDLVRDISSGAGDDRGDLADMMEG
jgi:anti-sigma regulatory factor (Ser/Thr protein kinase)